MNEKDFDQLKMDLEQIKVPNEKLSTARIQALVKFSTNKKRKRKISLQVAFIALFLVAFVTSIRVSPTIAQTIANIPGFAPLVSLITYDKGVKDILENDYYEELGIVQTKNDLTFTLMGIIADESGMMIFYQLESPKDISSIETRQFRVTQNNNDLPVSYTWSQGEPSNIIENHLEVVAFEPIDYSNPNFDLSFTVGGEYDTTFEVPFTLTKPIAKSKYIELNETVEIDGQKLILESFNISPLRAEIKLTTDPNNTMQIMNIVDLKLLDENGEEWGKTSNGVIGFGGFREATNSIFIQSNYFREVEKLTLVLDKLEALPKGEDFIEIDFSKQEIIKNPLENEINLKISGPNSIDAVHMEGSSQLISNLIDANGNTFSWLSHSTSMDDSGMNDESYIFDIINAVNPVKLYINSYPNYLDGSASIEIPINSK